MIATTATVAPGSVVTARPWRSGSELPAQRGIVMADQWAGATEYALVWFPRLGDPAVGATVMPIRQDKITELRPLSGEAPTFVRTVHRTCRRVVRTRAWRHEWQAAGFVIEAAARITRTRTRTV